MVALGRWRAGLAQGRARVLWAGVVAVVVATSIYTLAVAAEPSLGTLTQDDRWRIAIEVGGLLVIVVAALMLSILRDPDLVPATSALVAALAVIAATNVTFGLVAAVDAGPSGGLAFYPWLAGRYVAGALFVMAAAGRPRMRIRAWLAAGLGGLAAVDSLAILLLGQLPQVVRLVQDAGGLPSVVVVAPRLHLALLVVPVVLFGLGAWLAGRAFLRSGTPILALVALALLVQSFAHAHEMLQPAFFGPIVSSADLLRVVSFLLLAAGAFLEVRRLHVGRAVTVEAQQDDLHARQALVEQLSSLLDREQDFLAIVSHELATPIATVRAFTHVLARETTGPTSVSVRSAIDGISTELRRLSELIERIDELRDLEVTEFACRLRPVRLRPLLEEVAAFARGLPGGHPVEVGGEPGARVSADPVRLGQALRNVVGNAARYSPSGTPVLIEVVTLGSGAVEVGVIDHGPGIPSGERGDVMRRYRRGHAGRDRPGAGLGLYIASRIVSAHGGHLRIEDAPEHAGACVVIGLRPA